MMPEPFKVFYDAFNARMTALERDNADMKRALDLLDKDWRKKIAPAATGAAGTMTPKEEGPPKQDRWITPIDYPVNVRKEPRIHPSTKVYELPLGQWRKVAGSVIEGQHIWFLLEDGNYARDDVVHVSYDAPEHIPPSLPVPSVAVLNAALWPSPISKPYRIENTHLNHRNHKGVDLSAPMGTNIVNHAPAFVLKAFDCIECKPDGDGPQSVNVDHLGDGYGTFAILRYQRESLPLAAQSHPDIERYVFVLYGHMSDLDVTEGFPVRADSRIGRVGSTGNSSGPHLHLEARTSDTPNVNFYAAKLIDPALIFSF